MRFCNHCKQTKEDSEFAKRSFYYCKPCTNVQNKNYRTEQKRKDPVAFREKNRLRQLAGRQTSKRSRSTAIFTTMKHNAGERGIEVSITKDILFVMFELQNWTCSQTGIPFDLTCGKGKQPFGPSIDRIDTNKGYHFDNIQLVCNVYNYAKHAFTKDDVIVFAKAFVKHNKLD